MSIENFRFSIQPKDSAQKYEWISVAHGLSKECAMPYLLEIEASVKNYNKQNVGALYERGVEEMWNLYEKNQALLLIHENEKPVYYGAFEPRLRESGVSRTSYQVVEVVNAITHPEMRGQGIGSTANFIRSRMIFDRFGNNTIIYGSTVNRFNLRTYASSNVMSLGVWQYEPVAWHEFPYFAGLTCIFSARGQDHSHICSTLRRCPALSTPNHFTELLHNKEGLKEIPCTLFVSDKQKAIDFQERCRLLHGVKAIRSCPERCGVQDMEVREIGDFYDQL